MDVLILEDDSRLRFALSQLILSSGFRTHPIGTIEDAVDVLESVVPDVLLLDLMIGNRMSIEVADLAGYRAPKSDVIYLTGSTIFQSGELFEISHNTSWVLRKPVDFNELKMMFRHIRDSRNAYSASSIYA